MRCLVAVLLLAVLFAAHAVVDATYLEVSSASAERTWEKWTAGPICCFDCQYECCCEPFLKVPFTVRKYRTVTRGKTTATVTKTTVAGTVYKTVTVSSFLQKRQLLDTEGVQGNLLPAIREESDSESDETADETTDGSPISSFNTARKAQGRHGLCPSCPASAQIAPYNNNGRTFSGKYCCPKRKTVTRRLTRTAKVVVKTTRTKGVKRTVTATFVSAAQTLTGFLFDDINNNGVYDLGIDNPRPFVPVVLISLSSSARDSDPLDSGTTDGSGRYSFTAVVKPGARLGVAAASEPGRALLSVTVGSDGLLPNGGSVDVPLAVTTTTAGGDKVALQGATTAKATTNAGITTAALPVSTTKASPAATTTGFSTSAANQQTTTVATTSVPRSTTKGLSTTARPTAVFTGPSCTTDATYYSEYIGTGGNSFVARGPTNDTIIYLENISYIWLMLVDVSGPVMKHRNILTKEDNGSGFPSGVTVDAQNNIYVSDTGDNKAIYYISSNFTYLGMCPANLGVSGPLSVAVDSVGNVYYATVTSNINFTYTSEVWMISAGSPSSCPTPVKLNIDLPTKIAFQFNGLVVDLERDYMYLALFDYAGLGGANTNTTIFRCFTNGTGLVTVAEFSSGVTVKAITLDLNGDIWVNVDSPAFPNNLMVFDKDIFAQTNATATKPEVANSVAVWGGKVYGDNYNNGFGYAPLGPGYSIGNFTYMKPRQNTHSLTFHWNSQTIYSRDRSKVWKADQIWEQLAIENLNSTSDGLAVHPNTGDLYVADGTSIRIVDTATQTFSSTPISGLSSVVRAMDFGPTGNLYFATQDSVYEAVNGVGTPTLISSGYTIPPGNQTTDFPKGAIQGLAVDGSNNVYISTVGYYSKPPNSAVGVPSYIYRLANGTWTRTTAVTMDAATGAYPTDYGMRVALDYYDYQSRWYSFPIAAAGNGSTNGNALYVGQWESTSPRDVVVMMNGDPATNTTLDAKYQDSTALAASVGFLFGTSYYYKYQGCA